MRSLFTLRSAYYDLYSPPHNIIYYFHENTPYYESKANIQITSRGRAYSWSKTEK